MTRFVNITFLASAVILLFTVTCSIADDKAEISDVVPTAALNVPLVDVPLIGNGPSLNLPSQVVVSGNGTTAIPTLPQAIALGTVPPPLEIQREQNDANASKDFVDEVRIATGTYCSPSLQLLQHSNSHFELSMTGDGFHDWFMLHVENARGKTIRIDIVESRENAGRWTSLVPVYCDATDLDDPANYLIGDHVQVAEKPQAAWNGESLPPTTQQRWHYIQNVWSDRPGLLNFVAVFPSNSVYVAMRVPRPPGYNEHFLNSKKLPARAKILDFGTSEAGRKLLGVLFEASEPISSNSPHPTVIVYAGEHADEPDAMWACEGIIDTICDDASLAREVRQHINIIIIPCLDPDGAATGIHEGIISSFASGRTTPESIAYANWSRQWVESGQRIDFVLNLHNVQSSEAPVLSPALLGNSAGTNIASLRFHSILTTLHASTSIAKLPAARYFGSSPHRFGGWLSSTYGTLTLAYEINSQAPAQHSSISQVKAMGMRLLTALQEFSNTDEALQVSADVDRRRLDQLSRRDPSDGPSHNENAIVSEERRRALNQMRKEIP